MAEIRHDPGDNWNVVDDDSVADVDNSKADPLRALVGVVPGQDAAAAVCLSDRDFKEKRGYGKAK